MPGVCGEGGDNVTDLEITKLCAESVGLSSAPHRSIPLPPHRAICLCVAKMQEAKHGNS